VIKKKLNKIFLQIQESFKIIVLATGLRFVSPNYSVSKICSTCMDFIEYDITDIIFKTVVIVNEIIDKELPSIKYIILNTIRYTKPIII